VRDNLWWYVDRAGGLTSWLLLALSTGFGIATSARVLGGRLSRTWVLAVHRFLGGLAVVFLGVHVLGVLVNSHVPFSLVDAIVPWASHWRPGPMAWGIVAAWLALAVELTSLTRNRLPPRLWRWIHLSSYVLFFASTVHLITAGTDASARWLRLVAIAGTGAVAFVSIGSALEGTAAPQP
jgi:predicted ferric reductase